MTSTDRFVQPVEWVKIVKKAPATVLKSNPYHAKDGSFTSKDKAVSIAVGVKPVYTENRPETLEGVRASLEQIHETDVFTSVRDVMNIDPDKRREDHLKLMVYEEETGYEMLMRESGGATTLYAIQPKEGWKDLPYLLPPGVGAIRFYQTGTPAMLGVSKDRVINPRTELTMFQRQADAWRDAAHVAEKMGYDPDNIAVYEYSKKFQVGDKTFSEGGHYIPSSRKIVLNIPSEGKQDMSAEFEGLVAHEITHDAFNIVYESAIKAPPGSKTLPETMTFFEHVQKYKGQLISKDGVTEYSKAYWNAYEGMNQSSWVPTESGFRNVYTGEIAFGKPAPQSSDAGQTALRLAINETLAELSAIKAQTENGYIPSRVDPLWVVAHEKLMKAYEVERKARAT